MKSRIIFSLLIISLVFADCKKDKGESNDEELITTMILKFHPAGGTPFEFKFTDPDGPGGAPATADSIIIKKDGNYMVMATFLNETVNPAENITDEIYEENTSHRIYYQPDVGHVIIDNLNEDDNGMPLGTTSSWITFSSIGTGKVKVTLRHYPGTPPDKQAADPVNSPKSSTDIEVTFNLKVIP